MHTHNSQSHALSRVLFLIYTDIQRPRPACSYCHVPPAGRVTALTITTAMGLSTPHDPVYHITWRTLEPPPRAVCLLCCLPIPHCSDWAPPSAVPYWGSRWTWDGSQGGQSLVLVQDDKLERLQVGFQGQGTEVWAGSKWENRN